MVRVNTHFNTDAFEQETSRAQTLRSAQTVTHCLEYALQSASSLSPDRWQVVRLDVVTAAPLYVLFLRRGALPRVTIFVTKTEIEFPFSRVTDNKTLAIKRHQYQTLEHHSEVTAEPRRTQTMDYPCEETRTRGRRETC